MSRRSNGDGFLKTQTIDRLDRHDKFIHRTHALVSARQDSAWQYASWNFEVSTCLLSPIRLIEFRMKLSSCKLIESRMLVAPSISCSRFRNLPRWIFQDLATCLILATVIVYEQRLYGSSQNLALPTLTLPLVGIITPSCYELVADRSFTRVYIQSRRKLK